MKQEMRKQIIKDVIFINRTSIEVSDNLAKTQKELLVDSLETLIKFIPKIKAMSMAFHPKYEFFKHMMSFFDRLTRLMSDGFTALLNKAWGQPYTAVQEDEFIKLVNDASKSFLILWDKNKNLFRKNISEAIKLKMSLLDSLDELKPKTVSGQILLNLFKVYC